MNSNFAEHITRLMGEVVDYSSEHVREGGIPFTAYVVDVNGNVLGRGVNRVSEHHDPTAHAEVEAIRDACRNLGTSNLRGAILLASGEPCAMCYINAQFSGIEEVIFAADRNDAAAAGFDYRSSYQLLANFPDRWPMTVNKFTTIQALEPFNLWKRKRNYL